MATAFTGNAPSQQLFFASADRSFFVGVNEGWFYVDNLPRYPSLSLEYTNNVSFRRRSSHRVYRTLEHENDSSYRPANIKAYVESYLDCLESERMRDLHANYEYPNDDGSITYIYGDVHAHLDADYRVTHLQPGMNGRDNQYRPDWAENEEKVSCQ